MSKIALTTLEGLDVQVEYTYCPAEPDIGEKEEFTVIGVWRDSVDIIEMIKPSYITALENSLYSRVIGE